MTLFLAGLDYPKGTIPTAYEKIGGPPKISKAYENTAWKALTHTIYTSLFSHFLDLVFLTTSVLLLYTKSN